MTVILKVKGRENKCHAYRYKSRVLEIQGYLPQNQQESKILWQVYIQGKKKKKMHFFVTEFAKAAKRTNRCQINHSV